MKLFNKGVDVPSVVCSDFNDDLEYIYHHLIRCEVAANIWTFFERWCDVVIPNFAEIKDMVVWIDSLLLSVAKQSTVEAIVMIMWWLLWNFRNDIIFNGQKIKRIMLIASLINYLYNWFVCRNKKLSISRVAWFSTPILSIPL